MNLQANSSTSLLRIKYKLNVFLIFSIADSSVGRYIVIFFLIEILTVNNKLG